LGLPQFLIVNFLKTVFLCEFLLFFVGLPLEMIIFKLFLFK
jgi:hypothetical protein